MCPSPMEPYKVLVMSKKIWSSNLLYVVVDLVVRVSVVFQSVYLDLV
jgi:hypothetical protein